MQRFYRHFSRLLGWVFVLSLVVINWSWPAAATELMDANGHSFIAQAVEKVGAAVVRIDTERTIVRSPDPMLNDPFFRQFFPGLSPMPQEDHQRGQGSGFIIDASGIIMTNAHVVSAADTVTVTLKDGRVFQGEVRGVDEVSDLAIVQLKGATADLPAASLGDSSSVQVGDWAIAVGNPLGLDNTVTLGIVSTLHRSSAQVGIPDKRLEFIQTDAAINPGNSGGPLLNQAGEVIGINTAIRADAMGIGFAIPINKAKTLQDRLIRGEKISHAYLGVQMTTLTPAMAQENNQNPNSPILLPEVDGVLVVQVLANTPAAKAGLRWGDVITAVDGTPITSADQLQRLVDGSRVGQLLQIKLRRGEQTRQVGVRTAELQGAT
ncbi:HhoA/HhoB/HtrA family serine endopeptidase [Candidatus Synechococcus calcipolaris]|uniref:HhoA/HhoB/HtrA family serine endopeptidase n=1 Tax=Candidatus Synechococcus calcipolaris TaxID=1522304 RepID=UPI0030CA3BA8